MSLKPNLIIALFFLALHPSVGNLLGLDIRSNTLYAVSSNGRAVIRSHNYGETWYAVAMSVWTTAQAQDSFVAAFTLNDEEDIVVMEPEDHMIFTSGIWNDTWGGM